MPDDLSGDQISLLGDNARPLVDLQDSMTDDLATLIRKGYAEADDGQTGSPYRITGKGIAFLSERGAGLNEA
jgi:hypothetical protein